MRLASFTPCFLEHSLWGKPTTRLEDQLLRLSGCEEVASGYFESLPGERWSARARHSSHLKAGARHESWGKNKNKNHLRCGEGPRATVELRPQSALFRLASPLGHSAEAPALIGGEGWEALPLRLLPDFLTRETVCIRKWFPFSSLILGGSVYTEMDYQRWVPPLGLAVRYVFYKHTRTYFSKY